MARNGMEWALKQKGRKRSMFFKAYCTCEVPFLITTVFTFHVVLCVIKSSVSLIEYVVRIYSMRQIKVAVL
jgi:hypothetical protein